MIRDVKEFLKDVFPFSSLPPSSLSSISSSILVKFFPSGEIIVREGERPEYLYIIRKGRVSLLINGEEAELLEEGDFFGHVSLLGEEPFQEKAVAKEDTILYLLPKALFLKLLERYEEFEKFFTRDLAKKFSYLTKLLRSSSRTSTPERFLLTRIKNLSPKKAVILEGEKSVHEASRVMKEDNLTCVLVKDGSRIGIVTERDIIKKVVAEGLNPSEVKLKEIMSFPLITVDENSPLFDALILMARNNIRRIVVEDDGDIKGILEEKDIIAFESKNLIVIVKEIEKAKDIETLRYLHELSQEMVMELFSEGSRVEHITRIISEINDRLIGKAVELTIRDMEEEPPSVFSVMVLGSEGRREQTLKTDQDNALVYDDGVPSLDIDKERYFLEFGRRLSENLIKLGFPECPGRVMTSNKEWNMGFKRWKEKIERMVSNPSGENVLNTGIFLDFRNAFGSEDLVESLRDFLFEISEKNEIFISYLLLEGMKFRPRFSLFGTLKGESIDIKKFGIFPLVHTVRCLSLKAKIRETSTSERIEKLKEKGFISEKTAGDLKEAFEFLQHIRLKVQIEKMRSSKKPDNIVEIKKLPRLEKELLKDSLKIVSEFLEYIEMKYLSIIPR